MSLDIEEELTRILAEELRREIDQSVIELFLSDVCAACGAPLLLDERIRCFPCKLNAPNKFM